MATHSIYETIVIFKPGITIDRVYYYKDIVKTFSGMAPAVEDKGEKRLAYSISKSEKEEYSYGHYILFTYYAKASDIHNLESDLRLDSDVLKYITVSKSEDDTEEYKKCTADIESAQSEPDNSKPDAMDVLLGLAKYEQKESKIDSDSSKYVYVLHEVCSYDNDDNQYVEVFNNFKSGMKRYVEQVNTAKSKMKEFLKDDVHAYEKSTDEYAECNICSDEDYDRWHDLIILNKYKVK